MLKYNASSVTLNTDTIGRQLEQVRARIADAERRFGRTAGSVRLLAVSKTHPPELLEAACQFGQRAFGESYLQEAQEKTRILDGLGIEWHFIGPMQSNKTRPIAEAFQWVHSVDRIKIARRLDEQRPQSTEPLNICLQVNISGENSKSGVAPEAVFAMAEQLAAFPRLRLRGLMALPAPAADFDARRVPFARLRALFEALNDAGCKLDTLSMGMSEDMEAAIAEGATIVRVGSAIFGSRR